MTVRLVTAMFDLSDEVSNRDPLGMIKKTPFLSSGRIDLTLYISRNLITYLPAISSNIHVVPMDREELPLWKHHATVESARRIFWPTRDPRAPAGSHLVTSSKAHLVCRTIASRPAADPSAWVYWIDFGKDYFGVEDVEGIASIVGADLHLQLCNVVDPHLFQADLRTYFNSYRFSVCGTLVGAREDYWPKFSQQLEAVFDQHLAAGVGHGEEQQYNFLLQDQDFLANTRLHLAVGDYQQSITNLFSPRENKAHCAWVLRRMIETGRRDLLQLARPYLAGDPQLEALAR